MQIRSENRKSNDADDAIALFFVEKGRITEMETVLCPKQPFFLNMTSHYRKAIVMRNGISHFYEFQAENGLPDAIGIPDGCVDILFRCSRTAPDIMMCGTGLSPRPLILQKGETYFGVRFIPGYMPSFKQFLFADLVNRDIEFDTFPEKEELFHAIMHADTLREKMTAFLRVYQTEHLYVETDTRYDLKNYIRSRILSGNGTVAISQIAADAGYSHRYITKVFRENYGMTPKSFSEIVKFQHLLGYMQGFTDRRSNLMHVAASNDYYDESHMLRNFRKYMNETPNDYLRYIMSAGYRDCLDIV